VALFLCVAFLAVIPVVLLGAVANVRDSVGLPAAWVLLLVFAAVSVLLTLDSYRRFIGQSKWIRAGVGLGLGTALASSAAGFYLLMSGASASANQALLAGCGVLLMTAVAWRFGGGAGSSE